MSIKGFGKASRLWFGVVGMLVLVLVLAGCAAQSGAAQPGSQAATSAPALATEVAPAAAAAGETVTAAMPTVAAAATEAATMVPAATAATTTTVTSAATVMIDKNAKLGDILADEKGMTLYLYTKDTKNTSNCYDKCAVNWPPLLTAGAPKAGDGADAALLGTTTRKDGTTQVTYNGWPLYYWIKDQKPGDATGQDVGGVWYVLNAQGEQVETKAEGVATPEATSAATSGAATVMIDKNAKLGDILADEKGMTLYLYTKDTKNTSNCYDKCAVNWPPLLTAGAPKAGDGADAALLGTTTRKDGTTQVTYNGWPLYYWIKDQKPGDATGQDVGGVWYVLNAQGEQVETKAEGSSSTPAGKTINVSIKDFSFGEPLTVAAGTTVVWTNEDNMAHTVTAADKSFDSGTLDPGAGFSYTFTKAGSFDYICSLHPSMKGRVTVTG